VFMWKGKVLEGTARVGAKQRRSTKARWKAG
jgi:hypothetical protein